MSTINKLDTLQVSLDPYNERMDRDYLQLLFPTPFYRSILEVDPSILEFVKSQEFKRHRNGYKFDGNILECEEMKSVKKIITEKVKIFFWWTCAKKMIFWAGGTTFSA